MKTFSTTLFLNDLDDAPEGWYIAAERMKTATQGVIIESGQRFYCWNGWVCEDEREARRLPALLETERL